MIFREPYTQCNFLGDISPWVVPLSVAWNHRDIEVIRARYVYIRETIFTLWEYDVEALLLGSDEIPSVLTHLSHTPNFNCAATSWELANVTSYSSTQGSL